MLTKCAGSKCAFKYNCLRFLTPSGKFQAYGPFDVLRKEWAGCDFFEEDKTKKGENDVRQNGKNS